MQLAVNALSKAGAAIEAGEVGKIGALLTAQVVADLTSATSSASKTAEEKGLAADVLKGVSALQAAKSAGDAKKAYVAAVGALEDWAKLTNLASQLKGL